MNHRDILTTLIRTSALIDARAIVAQCELSGAVWWIAFVGTAVLGAIVTRIFVNRYMRFIERR